MARRTRTAKRFSPRDLGNGKAVTPIRTEFGTMEYEASLDGALLGYADTASAAEWLCDEAAALVAAACPALDCADLHALMLETPDAALALVAALTPEQRALQATCYAAYINELEGTRLCGSDVLNGWDWPTELAYAA